MGLVDSFNRPVVSNDKFECPNCSSWSQFIDGRMTKPGLDENFTLIIFNLSCVNCDFAFTKKEAKKAKIIK